MDPSRAPRGSAGTCAAGIAPGAGGGSTSISAFTRCGCLAAYSMAIGRAHAVTHEHEALELLRVGDRADILREFVVGIPTERTRRPAVPAEIEGDRAALAVSDARARSPSAVRSPAKECANSTGNPPAPRLSVANVSAMARASCPRRAGGNLSAFAASATPRCESSATLAMSCTSMMPPSESRPVVPTAVHAGYGAFMNSPMTSSNAWNCSSRVPAKLGPCHTWKLLIMRRAGSRCRRLRGSRAGARARGAPAA